ncbi:hypothetical protein ACWIUD_05180 [Helicobacter sp. 23-1044]
MGVECRFCQNLKIFVILSVAKNLKKTKEILRSLCSLRMTKWMVVLLCS